MFRRSRLSSGPRSPGRPGGFALHEAVRILSTDREECHYWATHGGVEFDLLVFSGGIPIGLEFWRTGAPAMTGSMHVALADLRLDRTYVLGPGQARFWLHERVEAVGLGRVCAEGLE